MKAETLDQVEVEVAKAAPSPDVPTDRVLTEWNENAAVVLALKRMPPLKTVGAEWYEYRQGVWRMTSLHPFRPVVLSIWPMESRPIRGALKF